MQTLSLAAPRALQHLAPSALPLRVLEDLPRRIRVGDSHQTGFIAAGVLLAVTGSLAVLWPAVTGEGAVSPWAWYLVVASAVAAADLRRRAKVADCAQVTLAETSLVHPHEHTHWRKLNR